MKIYKMNKICTMVLVLLLLVTSTFMVFADDEVVNTGSLNVYLHSIETKEPIKGIDLTIYKIANFENGMEMELINGFEEAEITVDLLADPNNTAAEYLDEYIKTHEVVELTKITSDENGWAELNGILDGIYYIYYDGSNDTEARVIHINSMVVASPYLDGEILRRDLECKPKCEENSVALVYITWDDAGYEYKRPEYIEVSLLKVVENEVFDKVNVTADMDWMTSWLVLPNAEYDIEYTGVPSDYTTSIKLEGENVWHIHNVYKPSGYPPTGDESNLTLDLILIISGVVLLAGAITLLVVRNHKKSAKVDV